MKIGFFTDSYLPRLDGVSTSVDTCARALQKKGHEVYIIAPRYPRYKDKNKNVYRLASVKFPTTPGTPETRVALQLPEKPLLQILRLDFDIIHGHSGGGMTFAGLQIARGKNIPYVFTYHTLFNRYTHYFFKGKLISPRMIEFISKFVLNLCDYAIAPTQRVKKELISYGVKKPVGVIPSGIDLENYQNVEKGYLRKKLRIPKNKKIMLYVGRLGLEKSVDFLIRSFKHVHEKDPHVVLVCVGNGPEEKALISLAKELGVEKCVYFAGLIKHNHIPKVYADADIFVFASQTETQGLVVLESLASGVPVVAVNDEAFNDVIYDGKNGYLVDPDPRKFAKKTLTLLSNEKLYAQLSQGAFESVEKYSVEKMVEQLEKLYTKLIDEKVKSNTKVLSVEQFKKYFTQAKTQLLNYLETS